MKESHRNVGRITYATTRDGGYAASVSPTQSGVPRDRSSSPPEGVAPWPEGDRCAAATRDRNGAAHAPQSPRGAPPNMDHPSQAGAQADLGGSAPRREAVGPSAPSPRQRTCTHEQRVPDPTGDGLFRSMCATADAQHRSPQRTTGSGATRGGCQAQHRSPSARGASSGQSNDRGPMTRL